MKNIVLIALCGILMASCAKEVEVCIDGDMNPSEPGTYTYTWCGANADNIEWTSTWDGVTYAGESVTFTFDQKLDYSINVLGTNKKKEDTQNFTISVGEYETRVELEDCSGNNITQSNFRAYLYDGVSSLQTDLRNGNFSSCIDSVNCEESFYYNNSADHSSTNQVAGFTGLPVGGSYLIYVQQYDDGISANYGLSNIAQLIEASGSNITVNNGDWDDILFARISTDWSTDATTYVKNLFSKTFALTEVSVNGTSTGVPTCNADDTFELSIDNTWEYNVGADNCTGNQTTSVGTWSGLYNCLVSPTNNGLSLSVSSGSLAVSQSVGVNYYTANSFDLYTHDGTNQVTYRFTAQ